MSASLAVATAPVPARPLLEVSGLTIGFPNGDGYGLAADRVEFSIAAGETLGIVGESGCGKSVTLRALLGIVPKPGQVLAGSARWRGNVDLLRLGRREQREVRGREIAMIFQDPQASLNPVYTIGDQLVETLTTRAGMSRRPACKKGVELLEKVGIPSPARRMRDYPHHLSGGMRQRVMIAIAVACGPALLLADEPTTALDVTIQDQILSLIAELQRETGLAVILVSHDLGVIGQTCDRVSVMYGGRVVESGDLDDVMTRPRHPYTAALLTAVPRITEDEKREMLSTIQGQPPSINDLPTGCYFAPRCEFARTECRQVEMTLDSGRNGQRSACPIVDASSPP